MTIDFEGTAVIPHPTSVVQQYDTQGAAGLTPASFTSLDDMKQIIENQISVANQALTGSPFQFRNMVDSLSTVQNENYARYPIDNTIEMSANLGSGDLRILDVYLSYSVLYEREAANPPLRVGTTFLPSQQLLRKSDGLFLRYDTLTGGGLSNFDDGITFIHEFGHW